jgi:hypothetical protein
MSVVFALGNDDDCAFVDGCGASGTTATAGTAIAVSGKIEAPHRFLITAIFFSLQLLSGLFGLSVLRRTGYFGTYLSGPDRSPSTYGLICPAVGLFVFGMFFLHVGLVRNGLIEQFSPAYFVVLAALAVVQVLGIVTMIWIDQRLFSVPVQSPAEAGRMAS